MKTFIIYHKADLDGLFGARACSQGFPEDVSESDIEYVPMQYGDEIDIERMKGHFVRMVDFSLPREKMEWLNLNTDFVWIDHHKSAIEEMQGLDIKGTREIGKSGCLLAYEEFSQQSDEEFKIMTLLSKYDTRNKSDMLLRENDILPFQYGMRLEVGLDLDKVIDFMNSSFDISLIKMKGKVIMDNNKIQREGWMKKSGEVEINGLKGLALFGPVGGSSQIFESHRDNTKYDLMIYITYNIAKREYAVSLYSDKESVDCSVIAKSFGGGGHKGASGFVCNSLPFSL